MSFLICYFALNISACDATLRIKLTSGPSIVDASGLCPHWRDYNVVLVILFEFHLQSVNLL